MNTALPIWTLSDVLEATEGKLLGGGAESTFNGISTDSRQISPGNLYVALSGERFDGHHFVAAALDGGASGVLLSNPESVDVAKLTGRACIIRVQDTLKALGDLAQAYRLRFSIPVIAITGSSGKTTTKEMLAAILEQEKVILKTQGNFNNQIGLPQTLFRLTGQHEVAILEMGTNMRGEIRRLTDIARPDIGLITNIGPAHLAGFGSVEAVREEKGDLFFAMNPSGTAVVNLDDEAVRLLAERWPGRTVTFSMSASADVRVRDVKKNGARGMIFHLHVGEQSCRVDMKIAGVHNIYNAMGAAAAAYAGGATLESIRRGLSNAQAVSGRMEMIRLQNGAYLVNDAYNANPASVREALLTLRDMKGAHRAFVLLGDMLELGDAAAEMHRKVGMLLATTGVAAVFLQGDYAGHTASGALDGGLDEAQVMFLDRDDFVMTYLKKQVRKGDWILLKGSRRLKMDRFVSMVCEQFGDGRTEASEPAHPPGGQT